jgi:hypothetical protein
MEVIEQLKRKNPAAVALGRKGGKAGKGQSKARAAQVRQFWQSPAGQAVIARRHDARAARAAALQVQALPAEPGEARADTAQQHQADPDIQAAQALQELCINPPETQATPLDSIVPIVPR